MGKSLVIVESPAKAKTISKILGADFVVEASIGHIRDLPKSAKDIPVALKKASWSRLGVNIEADFEPLYVVSNEKKEQVLNLKSKLDTADTLYLATDEDREGESIAWHLLEVLQPKVPVKRLVFHEITPKAIRKALENVRDIKLDLVQAQEVRRVVDRLYGYQVSPLLWDKLKNRNLSAGRVQSAALRLTVQRERERLAFVSADWWSIEATLWASGKSFLTRLSEWDNRQIATGASFNDKGELSKEHLVLDENAAKSIVTAIHEQTAVVVSKKTRPFTEKPKAPFITSTLQQEAIRKLRWTARRTMSVAQKLYENGWITYMRTDSTSLSEQALSAARGMISSTYGDEYLPTDPIVYSNSKDAQEAHEAIRPAGEKFKSLVQAKSKLAADESKLYELIWKRTIASQMLPAKGERLTAKFSVDKALLVATGKSYTFQGFRLAYVEGADDEEAALAEKEKILPMFAERDELTVNPADGTGHSTKAPARFTEASLVKTLEQKGIGRPSTYASIIDNIINRQYVYRKGSALTPTFRGMIVTQVLERYLTWLVDYGFTSRMEANLDLVAAGEMDRLTCLQKFYFGDEGLEKTLAHADQLILAGTEHYALAFSVEAEESLTISFNRYGEFIQLGEERVYINEQVAPDELTLEKVQEIIRTHQAGPLLVAQDPSTELPIYLKNGRFGLYLQLGEAAAEKGAPKPKQVSLLRGMTADSLTPEQAIELVGLPKTLGRVVVSDVEVDLVLNNGRYGPYLTGGKTNVSIPASMDALTLTYQSATELFNDPKRRKGELKNLGEDDQGNTIVIKSGRFGPYITNGSVNASLGKRAIEDIDMTVALQMLVESKNKPKRKRKAAAKPTTTTTKKATKAKTKKSTAKKKAKKSTKKATKKTAASTPTPKATSGRASSILRRRKKSD